MPAKDGLNGHGFQSGHICLIKCPFKEAMSKSLLRQKRIITTPTTLISKYMSLILLPDSGENSLATHYRNAFKEAVELYVVSAYLTEWDASLKLSKDCRKFRIIVGRDFGVTRKAACEAVMKWLPSHRKSQFLVADNIDGFHPKAVFWMMKNGECYAIVGSSNLTRAAFQTNYEANFFSKIDKQGFAEVKRWLQAIEKKSIVVSEDWLAKYSEAPKTRRTLKKVTDQGKAISEDAVVNLDLPATDGMEALIKRRRAQIKVYNETRKGLHRLFSRCAKGIIDSSKFYEELPNYWYGKDGVGSRLQGAGWERLGKGDDFHSLSQSYLRIIRADKEDRDDVVSEEIDLLKDREVGLRKAFLSEMLCLEFPDEFPVLNKPVRTYLADIKLRSPRGASEGAKYVYLAKTLRAALTQNPKYPAKNLAELDTVIWKEYGEE